PAATSQRGSRAPKAAGTATPAISSPNGTTLPGPPAAKLRSCSARTSAGEAGPAGRGGGPGRRPERPHNAAPTAPPAHAHAAPANAIVAPGARIPRVRRRDEAVAA